MSWHYLQEQEEDFSLPNYLDGIRSVDARYKSTQEKSYYKDKEMDISTSSQYGMMSQPLTEDLGVVQSTLFQEDFPVKTSQQLAKEKEFKEKGVHYGKSIKELLAKLNLDLSLLKTPHYLELEGLSLFSKTLMNWGMMQDGVCLGLGILKHLTKESECGLWLPTPTCHNAQEGGYPSEGRRHSKPLGWVLGGKINPRYTEWMMGWVDGWTDLKPLEMDKFQLWQQTHGEY